MNDNEHICPICGEHTYKYYGNYRKDGLCFQHGRMANAGEITQCDTCGQWHNADKECPNCSQVEVSNLENQETGQQNNPDNKCLLCGNDSGDYMFCKSCFAKYRNKTLLMKITVDKNQHIEILNESYEGIYVCKDGHVVKSKSERDIDNYLFDHKIPHAYEKALPINGEVFKPDFYLPDLDVYIEHWGYDESNVEYTRRKEYKIPKYKEKGITLICTYEATDMKDVETSLQIKLDTYKKGEINFL